MTPEEITALAHEYGEYTANNPIFAPYLDTDEKKDINLRANAHRAKDVIKWMADRFCLVEKSKVMEIYEKKKRMEKMAGVLHKPLMGIWFKAELKSLEDFFPEIVKEVEK